MTISIRRILYATDFSEPAKQARQYAMALAERFGAELHLLHILPDVTLPLPDSASSWTLPDIALKSRLEAAEKQLLQELNAQWSEKNRTVRTATVGIPVDEIVKYAKQNEIDLIVIGTHGHTGLTRLLLGSVAEKVVRLATCPVFTVHPKGHQFLHDETTG